MAFSAAFRRATSAAAHFTVRSHSSSLHTRLSTVVHPLSLRNAISERIALTHPCVAFFSSATKPTSDTNLLRVIDSEIKCAKESEDHDRVSQFRKKVYSLETQSSLSSILFI